MENQKRNNDEATKLDSVAGLLSAIDLHIEVPRLSEEDMARNDLEPPARRGKTVSCIA